MTRPPTGPRSPLVSALLSMLAVSVVAGVLLAVCVTPAIALTGAGARRSIDMFEQLPGDLRLSNLAQKTEIYARDGRDTVLLASFFRQNREVVSWQEVPRSVRNAALAGEDIRFYQHGGVDPAGIARAVVADALGKDVQGASTITQQYVKNVCVQEAERARTEAKQQTLYEQCTDPTVGRKVREMRLAIGVEKAYTKDQILLGYLNIAGFGGRIYGIESAAEYYFDEKAKDLTVAQSAALLAIVNNPEKLRLDDDGNLKANTVRRDYILDSELRHGMITRAEHDEAVRSVTKPSITPAKSGCQAAGVAGFFCDYVVNVIKNDSAFGATEDDRIANLQDQGWKIYTTLDLGLEKKAQSAMNDYVPMKSDSFDVGGAAVSVEVGTGRIISMVQNKIFNDTGDAKRLGPQYSALNLNSDQDYGGSGGLQPGSTYKLFTLLDWLKKGHALYETVDGNARTIPASDFTRCGRADSGAPWDFGNDENETGDFDVLTGTQQSVNGVFASMAEQLDLCDIRTTAAAMDVHPAKGGTLQDNPSSVIGSGSLVSPLSMATAYAGMAGQGRVCTPVAIDKVVKPDGSELPAPRSSCTQGVDKAVAAAANYALQRVISSGTASGDQTDDGVALIGKTGTTDGNANTWMVGSSSRVATAVWVGNIQGFTDLRQQYDFPYCPVKGSSQAAIERHCVWRGIQSAVNAVYGGDTSFPQPDPKYLYGGVGDTQADPTTETQTGIVPDVSGMSKEEAESALVAAGFKWAIGDSVASDQPEGQVVSTTPANGQNAPPETEVVIHPSLGSG